MLLTLSLLLSALLKVFLLSQNLIFLRKLVEGALLVSKLSLQDSLLFFHLLELSLFFGIKLFLIQIHLLALLNAKLFEDVLHEGVRQEL